MSTNNQRYRSGPLAEARVAIKAGDTCKIGDIMGQSGNYARPYDTLAAGTATFHDEFLGILQQGATLGTETADGNGLVATSGEFEFPLDVAADGVHPVGTYVGPISNQVVTITGVPLADAIGVLARNTALGDTTVLVRLKSVTMDSGLQTPA